ncbi:tetratricopeptide repeat domain-containing protein, partial [Linderina macrospora]
MSAALELLGEIRQSSERRPFEVLKLAEPLLNKGTIRQAGDDPLDEGQFALAKSILDQLYKQFPGSQRVKRLYGLINEGLGHPEEAQQLYKEMLAADETNVLAAKRQIAMLKASGDHAMAIGELNTYLDTHSNDFEAWLELAHLYLGQHMYAQAAFCLEEVILQQPANHYFHLKYAELLYSMGSLGKALKEFLR